MICPMIRAIFSLADTITAPTPSMKFKSPRRWPRLRALLVCLGCHLIISAPDIGFGEGVHFLGTEEDGGTRTGQPDRV